MVAINFIPLWFYFFTLLMLFFLSFLLLLLLVSVWLLFSFFSIFSFFFRFLLDIDLDCDFIIGIKNIFDQLFLKRRLFIIITSINFNLELSLNFNFFDKFFQIDIQCVTLIDSILKIGVLSIDQKLYNSTSLFGRINHKQLKLPSILLKCLGHIESWINFLRLFVVKNNNNLIGTGVVVEFL